MPDPTAESSPPASPSTRAAPAPARRGFAAFLSALVPGLGQVALGRTADALLFVCAALWVHAFFLGLAPEGARIGAAIGLAFGTPRGFAIPVSVVFTAVGLALHAWAALDAWRDHTPVDGRAAVAPERGRARYETSPM